MAPASKANYKTYEAQARMVRAIVAAHPDVKWNYKGKPCLLSSIAVHHSPSSIFPCSASFADLDRRFSFICSSLFLLSLCFIWGEG